MTPQEELKKSIEEMGKNFKDFKDENEKRLKAVEEGKSEGDYKAHIEKIDTKFNELQDQVDKATAAINRAGKGIVTEEAKEQAELIEKKASEAMAQYMRTGSVDAEGQENIKKSLADLEQKGLSVSSNPDGGYFVRPTVSSNITKRLFETSPMRSIADQMTIVGDAFEEMYDADEAEALSVGEKSTRGETASAQVKMIRIPVHEIYAQPALTQKIIDDAGIDIEAWHQNKVIEKFGRKENKDFVTGDGVLTARGFLSYEATSQDFEFNKLQQFESSLSADISGDDLMDLQGELFEEYQANAVWTMKRQTYTKLRKLKDADGRYLFSMDPAAGLNQGAPVSLLGAMVKFMADMPAVAANSLSIAYGDFKKGYLIIDRLGIRVIRDIYTKKGSVLMYTTKRFGGGVRDFQAIKILKTKA